MPTRLIGFALVVVLAFVAFACSTSPLGRKQLHLFPSSTLDTLGASAFAELKSKTPQTTHPALRNYVSCVAAAITTPLGDPGAWEVAVFADESVNAFALPGRKIGVYQGMLDVATTQDELAAVIGHEVAHVLAEHSNERLSNKYLVGTVLDMVAGRTGVSRGAYAALGLGVQVGILLPYGRTQEEEADLFGLDLMAQAGFNPTAAVTLWQKMAQREKRKPPEFLSTHPADESRIQSLRARLPGAQQTYAQRLASGNAPVCRAPVPSEVGH
jgi:predicted Zn-dependent protease